jgi:putative zinc ribbon protein
MKNCIACGFPMTKSEDYPNGDESKDYCMYCAHADGSMQNYEQRLVSLSDFLQKTQGLDEVAARETAIARMAELPAWKK